MLRLLFKVRLSCGRCSPADCTSRDHLSTLQPVQSPDCHPTPPHKHIPRDEHPFLVGIPGYNREDREVACRIKVAWGEISSVLCRISVGLRVKQLLFTFKVEVKFGIAGRDFWCYPKMPPRLPISPGSRSLSTQKKSVTFAWHQADRRKVRVRRLLRKPTEKPAEAQSPITHAKTQRRHKTREPQALFAHHPRQRRS